MSYMKENFMLKNKTAEKLYFSYAAKMPIFDYHCHLSEYEILENKKFKNIYDVWLKGDHYKWRLMRNFGISEEKITGNASDKEKFLTYCRVLGTAYGNPLYHWSQSELKEFFGCELEINLKNAEKIWEECNDYIEKNDITPQKLIEKSDVKCIFTTNEIFDDLSVFEKIKEKGYNFKVIPAFRADKIMNIDAEKYNEFVNKLGDSLSLNDLENAIEIRLKTFIKVGTKASDIAQNKVYAVPERCEAEKVFVKRRKGENVTQSEAEIFKGYLTYYLMKLYAKYDIRTELHVGAMRNNNKRAFDSLGLDTGYDSISSDDGIKETAKLFDRLNTENSLPKIVLFNLNPKMNLEMLTLAGCFQDESARGKIQYGPAWWFSDSKEGMIKHLKDLTQVGHIGAFIGMLTDSRSFLSYPRHGYFRRILCSYLGELIENGEMTDDIEAVGKVVEDISYNNAINYFGVKL